MKRISKQYILYTICFIGLCSIYFSAQREYFQIKQEEVGFVVTRYVKKPHHNTLYKECYEAIRKYHPELKIVFIDDNSDKLVLDDTYPMKNVEIIESEYPAAGEYLPYWYLLQRKMFKKAIFIQDSMILNSRIPYEEVDDYMFLYELPDDGIEEGNVRKLLNNTKIPEQLNNFKNSGGWRGCWGSTMVITSDFLQRLEQAIEISRWKDMINNRSMRIALESAIGIACMYIRTNTEKNSLFGYFKDTGMYINPGNEKYTLNMYLTDKTMIKDKIIKIWNGR